MVRTLAAFAEQRTSKKTALLLVVAGALSALAMAPLFAWPILFFTFPFLIWSLDHSMYHAKWSRRFGSGFFRGWLFGFGYFLAGLYWIAFPFLVEAEKFAWLLPVAVAVLPAGLALFYGLASGLATFAGSNMIARIFALAFCFGTVEWLRCWVFTGFPWNLIGYGIAPPGPLLHSAGLFGGVGLSALIVLIMSPLAFARAGWRPAAVPLVCSVGALALLLGYGVWVRSLPDMPEYGPVMRIVQPNISQRQKLDKSRVQVNLDRLLETSRTNAHGRLDNGAGAQIILWPESVFRFIVMEEPIALAAIAGLVGPEQSLVTGAMRLDRADGQRENFKIWNSVFAFDGTAALTSNYDKKHLVPFGEYLPMQNLLEAIGLQQLTRIRGGFVQGKKNQRFVIPGLPEVLSLVCYEIIFPFEVLKSMDATKRAPQWLLNVTNDAWFGTSSGPFQHLHQSQLRAVETGLPVVRVANTGVSALIDGRGYIRSELALNVAGSLDVRLRKPHPRPLFSKVPFFVTGGVLLFCLISAVAFAARRRQVPVYDA